MTNEKSKNMYGIKVGDIIWEVFNDDGSDEPITLLNLTVIDVGEIGILIKFAKPEENGQIGWYPWEECNSWISYDCFLTKDEAKEAQKEAILKKGGYYD